MVIKKVGELRHWNYFLALEEDLARLARYVHLTENDETYSLEIARLLMSSSAEVDVVLKQVCEAVDPQCGADNINAYFPVVSGAYPTFVGFEVHIPRFGLILHPWSNWKEGTPPGWWIANNKVKHHRHSDFKSANLKNCLNGLAGLYVAVLFLYRQEAEAGDLQQLPRLFNVSDANFGGTSMGRYGNSFKYRLKA